MALNWNSSDYFSMLMHRDKRSHAALEMLVDDLHTDKERTINKFLGHSGSEDFLWGLVRLLGNANPRVAGNAAYIIGTLAESEFGSMRIIGLTSSKHADSKQILPDLTNMLKFNDSESVMNAAGTMGTLAESHEGRKWMLSEACLDKTIQYVTELLTAENIWTASNAALVLARLTIAEEGCEHLLNHPMSNQILTQLITSLGVDEAGRGMNAAFAIGRLCDLNVGRARLLALSDSEKMISSLARMLCCNDPGASKNACFALSCLATNKEGHGRLLRNSQSEEVLRVLSELLSSEDSETGWFAAMTLHTLASQPKGCLRLRDNSNVLPALKAVEARVDVHDDLKEEVLQTIEILKCLEKPEPPTVQVKGCSEIEVNWTPVKTKSGFTVKYQLFENTMIVWSGTDSKCTLLNKKPNTQYTYRLRAFTEGDNSPFSESVTVTTEESVPGPPTQLRVLGCTTTQLKIGWEPPEETYGSLRGYYVYNGDKMLEHTAEQSIIITGLLSNTSYEIQVCAATSKGKGPCESIICSTAEMGAHAPSKPEVNVRGRSEMHISWRSPEVPLGRIFRYEVLCNGEVMYSGTDLHCVIRQLRSDTEYTISVCAVTSEGKCESKPTKKKTAKDEFDGERAPLYQTPVKSENDKKTERPKSSKKRKSIGGSSSGITPTAVQENQRKASLTRANSANHSNQNKLTAKDNLPPLIRLSYTHGKQKDKDDGEVAASSVTRKASSHHQDGLPDRNDSLQKKNSNELKRLQAVLASRNQRTKSSGEDLSKPQEGEMTRPKPTKLRSGHHKSSASRVIFQPCDQTRTPPGELAQKAGAKVPDEDRMKPRCHQGRRASHPHVRQLDPGDRLGGVSRRGIVQDKSLSHSMPEGFVEVSIETLPTMYNGKQDTGISWIAHNRRAEFQADLAQIYPTGLLSSQCKTSQPVKPGIMELDCTETLSHSAGSGKLRYGPTNYIQRASTFVSSHRPSAKKYLDKIRSNAPSFSQLTPELSIPASMSVRNHNKFVPMQFRTQPANLPSAISRHNTQIPAENNFSHLDILPRSQSDVGGRLGDYSAVSQPSLAIPNSAAKQKDRMLGSSSTKEALGKTLSGEFPAMTPAPELKQGTHLMSPRDVPSTESIIGIGVSATHENNTLQSAR